MAANKITFNQRELDQLFTILSLFSLTGELKRGLYQSGGPAVKVAQKFAEFLLQTQAFCKEPINQAKTITVEIYDNLTK